jgi:uncharacterized membrane protein
MPIANIANKTCPFSTVVRMNTHIQQKVGKCQVNNISGTPELDINYSMGIVQRIPKVLNNRNPSSAYIVTRF